MPIKLTKIDDLALGQHLDLQPGDECFYWGEYQVGQPFDAGPTNQLIKNIKIKPSVRNSNPNRYYYKERDIARAGAGLAGPVRASPGPFTVVPVPPSKLPGNPEYDDRMVQIATTMVQGTTSEVRQLIRQTAEYEPSHASGSNRITVEELLAIYEIDDPARPPHNTVLVIDDMLTKGTHFRAIKTKVLQHFPERRVLGVFIARAVAPDPAADFEILV